MSHYDMIFNQLFKTGLSEKCFLSAYISTCRNYANRWLVSFEINLKNEIRLIMIRKSYMKLDIMNKQNLIIIMILTRDLANVIMQ